MRFALVIVQRRQDDAVAEWMLQPFKQHRLRLLTDLGLAARCTSVTTLADVSRVVLTTKASIVFVATSWRERATETNQLFSTLREQVGAQKKIVYLDSFDQSSSPFFGILPYVDLYVKKQLLRDRRRYLSPFKTGYVFADFVQEEMGADLNGWHFGSVAPSEDLLPKLHTGWNVATKKQLLRRLGTDARKSRKPLADRPLDVHYRVGLGKPDEGTSYYTEHRIALSKALARMDRGDKVVNVAGGKERISAEQFRAELFDSKLCVSAFGWGEVTDRDYEVVINRSALVKPDMSHLDTHPNIYLPGQTYIPFHWDASDLVEVCEYYLNNLDEAQRIADAAKQVYEDYVAHRHFVPGIGAILKRLSL